MTRPSNAGATGAGLSADKADSAAKDQHRPAAGAEALARRRIEAAAARARFALFFEVLWPIIVPLLCLGGLFLIISWFGLWPRMPDVVRFGLLGLFATALLFGVVALIRAPRPTAEAALSRVARESGTPHRPAMAFSDELAHPTEDPLTLALWRAHRARLLESLDRLKAGLPSPGMNARDPYALRYLVPLLLVVAFAAAGPERGLRIADALRPTVVPLEAPPRIDAWVTPPAYTGRPPIFLTGEAAASQPRSITVPEGSVVTVRMPGAVGLTATGRAADGSPIAPDAPAAGDEATSRPANAALERPPAEGAPAPQGETRFTLERDGSVEIARGQQPLSSWAFAVTPDEPPKISLTREPGATASGALSLAYEVSDDYGVVSARAEIESAEPTPGDTAARPLVGPPEVPLGLPRLRMREGTGETIRDLSSHPWAGAKVKMHLVATDEKGQTGASEAAEFVLPARRFTNPIARAVVEQRRNLALDANQAAYVAAALDAITLDPTKFQQDGAYLSLRAAYFRLVGARSDDDLHSVLDFLWQIALGIEDGDLSLAAQELRAAQEALRNAIENNASDAELEKAMADLREAMNRYLEAMARNAEQNPQANQQPMDPNARVVRQEDLQRMLDQIEDLARTGSREAAQQMLSELQQMMENLEAGRSMQAQQGQMGEMNQALDQLGNMIRRQQELMDQTYQMDPDTDGSGAGQREMTPEERQQTLDRLRQGQQDLAEALEQLQQQMQQGQGMPGQEGQDGQQGAEGQGMDGQGQLGQAGRAMGEAAGELGRGQPGNAVGRQGQALQALRDGARAMAEQMARQQGKGQGQGQGQPGMGARRGGPAPGEDPLGRQQRTRGTDLGSSVRVPDAIDTQRAREILDAIRRRLGDVLRPPVERDYLERLIDRY